jgi:hypothetical protein
MNVSNSGATENLGKPSTSRSRTRNSSPPPEWLPVSLRGVFLVATICISVILAILCIVVTVLSKENHGLRQVSNRSSFLFNFLPTLVAVLYALIWTTIAKDAIRTEPWAMANMPGGVMVSDSLLLDNELSWKHIVHALKPTKGGVRWALLLAITGNFVASVILNPLSAGLLQATQVPTTSP